MTFKLDNSIYKVGDKVLVVKRKFFYVSGHTEEFLEGVVTRVGKTALKLKVEGMIPSEFSVRYTKTKVMTHRDFDYKAYIFKDEQQYADYEENKRLTSVTGDLKEAKASYKELGKYIKEIDINDPSVTAYLADELKGHLTQLIEDIKDWENHEVH